MHLFLLSYIYSKIGRKTGKTKNLGTWKFENLTFEICYDKNFVKIYDPIAISLVVTWLTFVESDWFSAILFWRVIIRYSYFQKTPKEDCFWNLLSLNLEKTPSTVPSDRHLGFEQSVSCGIWTESDVALVIFVPPLRKIYNKLFKMYPIARLTCSRNVIAQFQKPAVSAVWANQVTFLKIFFIH